MLRRRPILVVIALLFGFAIPSGAAPASPPVLPVDVPMAGAHFPGAPPPFVQPAGGSTEVGVSPAGVTRFSIRRPDGTLFAEADIDSLGRAVAGYWYDEKGELTFAGTQTFGEARFAVAGEVTRATRLAPQRSRPFASARAAASCGLLEFSMHPWQLPAGTFTWKLNASSIPSYMNASVTESYLRSGHVTWYQNDNWCGTPDQSVFGMAFGGHTTATYGFNGVNTVGFGNMATSGCISTAIGCTSTWTSNGFVTESDTRLNQNSPWVNGKASGKYDTWSLMVHELGHTLGFNHVGDDDNVMYESVSTNDITDQKLGKGDADANNTKY